MTQTTVRLLWAVTTVLSFTAVAFSQAPRTVSHQGLLTDTGGTPVADASRTMTFKIYDVDTGGSALWTESKSVSTVKGIYNTILGSDSPITGVDFGQDLWLGIKVATDGEMPRSKLTGVPYALGLAMPFEDTLHVQTADLGTDGSESINEDVTVHSNDAMIGMYSDAAGIAGSGIQMGEILGGALVDKWTMYRATSSAASNLLFSYGRNTSYGANQTRVIFDSTGVVIAKSFQYADPKPSLFGLGTNDFNDVGGSTPGWRRTHGYPDAGGPNTISAPVHLPHGAQITNFKCKVYDTSDIRNLTCTLWYSGHDLSAGSEVASVVSSGTSGFQTIPTAVSHTVSNDGLGYHVSVASPFWNTLAGALRLRSVTIEYTTLEAQ